MSGTAVLPVAAWMGLHGLQGRRQLPRLMSSTTADLDSE